MNVLLTTRIILQEIRWDIVAQAMRPGTDLSLSRCTKFHDEDFPGYVCKRNKNGQTFKNVRTRKHVGIDMSSFCYTFSRGDNSLISVPSTSLVDTSHIAETDEGATDAAVTPTLSRYATEKLSCEDALPQCFAKGDSSTLTHGSQPVSEVESADATITSPFLSSTDIVREALEVADAHASTTRPGDNQGVIKTHSLIGRAFKHRSSDAWCILYVTRFETLMHEFSRTFSTSEQSCHGIAATYPHSAQILTPLLPIAQANLLPPREKALIT